MRVACQLLFEVTKNMPADVIEISFVISDEVLWNSEGNIAESLASHFSPSGISLPGPSRRLTKQETLEQLREIFSKEKY